MRHHGHRAVAGAGGGLSITSMPSLLAAHRWDLGTLNASGQPAANGENVATWQDQSGNNNHLVLKALAGPVKQADRLNFYNGGSDYRGLGWNSNLPVNPSGGFTLLMKMNYGVPQAYNYTTGWVHDMNPFLKRVGGYFKWWGIGEPSYGGPFGSDIRVFGSTTLLPAVSQTRMFVDGTLVNTGGALGGTGRAIKTVGYNALDGSAGGKSMNDIAGVVFCGDGVSDEWMAFATDWLNGVF